MSGIEVRCAVLSSFTLDLLPKRVDAQLRATGPACTWYIAPFGQYGREILDDTSQLAAFRPDLVLLMVAVEDLAGDLATRLRAEPGDEGARQFVEVVDAATSRYPDAAVLVPALFPLTDEPQPWLASRNPRSTATISARTNADLLQLAQHRRNLHILDPAALLRAEGSRPICDPRLLYLARMRLGDAGIELLARYVARAIRARSGLRRKCIVTDLDGTLWGGIVGEEGIDRLDVGPDGIGRAYRDLQAILLALQRTGVLLAICSKNDPDLALAALREHPGMLLRENDFAAIRANWDDKAENLVAIAEELNLGLDSFVFLDDSPFERQHVRSVLPQVFVPELPTDAAYRPAFVCSLPCFDTLSITEADTQRAALYVAERERKALATRAASLEEFLASLRIRVDVERAKTSESPRVAQLTQKTNQFNLTTRRYTEREVAAFIASRDWLVLSVRAQDSLGENGLVGAAFIHLAGSAAVIDVFLLSCRVLGRGIEHAMMSGVLAHARSSGVTQLVADYVPSPRNRVAEHFLADAGFTQRADARWTRATARPLAALPRHIELQIQGAGADA